MGETGISLRIAGHANVSVQLVTKEVLAQTSGLSESTISRLKKRKQIVYYQPGGPGTAVLFPADAIQRSSNMEPIENSNGSSEPEPKTVRHGRKPKWMED